jgi:hypothetical protein
MMPCHWVIVPNVLKENRDFIFKCAKVQEHCQGLAGRGKCIGKEYLVHGWLEG